MRRPVHRRLPPVCWLAPLLVAAACGLELEEEGADTEATTTTVAEVVEDDAPPVVVGAPTIMEELESGDCFNEYRWEAEGRRIEVVTELPCGEPHKGEVYLVAQYPAPFGTPYPGDDAMARYARGTCYDAFEAFVGIPFELSAFEIGVVTPNQTNFEDEDARYRGITCYVFQPEVSLVGSARGTRT